MLNSIPTYSSYYESIKEGASIFYYELEEENGFKIDKSKLDLHIIENHIDLLVLINPNNPTGLRVENDVIEGFIKET